MIFSVFFIGVIVLIIFAVVGIIEGKSTMKKSQVIRSLYFYLASLVTLGIVVGSLIFLVNVGLKTYIFTDADPVLNRIGPPPSMYFMDGKVPVDTTGLQALQCSGECTLTSNQKATIDSWQTSYAGWLEAKSKPNSQRASDLVAALSFLIVALPIFIIHFRILQKEAKHEEAQERSVIRPIYFYFISLAALLMIVIAGGMLINVGLKTWVIKSADQTGNQQIDNQLKLSSSISAGPSEKTPIQSIVDCGAKCGLGDTTVSQAKQWLVDYSAWEAVSNNYNNKQRQAASEIPFVLLGIPLFWYHWSVVRKELREKKEQSSQPIQKV
jgi:hypothetical protein